MPSVTADNRFYVDLSSSPAFGTYVSVYPEELSFEHEIRGVGNIDFQLSYSALDQDGDPAVTPPTGPDNVPFIGPMRSYWRLRYGDVHIIAGVITKTNSKLGTDYMAITGKTWEHFMERWQYPYDPRFDERTPGDPKSAPFYDYAWAKVFQNDETTPTGNDTPDGLAYLARNRDVIRILKDLITTATSVPNRVSIDFASLANLSGIKAPTYYFSLGQMDYFDSIINGLAEMGEGFDWWITWDKKFKWATPYRFGPYAAPNTMYSVDFNDDISGFLAELEFTNNGPRATHVTGFGTGLAAQNRMGRAYGYAHGQTDFSRLDADYDFGDVRNGTAMTEKTQKQLSRDLNPDHEIPFSVDPNLYPAGARQFWMNWRVGRAIWINYDMGYHIINSGQRLKGFRCNMSREGNGNVDWTLEQIYNTSANAGTVEG